MPKHFYLSIEIVQKLEQEDNASALVQSLLEQHYENQVERELMLAKQKLKDLKKSIEKKKEIIKEKKKKLKQTVKLFRAKEKDVIKFPLAKVSMIIQKITHNYSTEDSYGNTHGDVWGSIIARIESLWKRESNLDQLISQVINEFERKGKIVRR